MTRRRPAWSTSPGNVARRCGQQVHSGALRAPRPATGDRRPRPALHAARARRRRRHRRPAHHPRVLPGVKARRWRSVRFAALGLDAGSARATDGQLSDDASPRSRTLPSRHQLSRGWIRRRVNLRRNGTIGEPDLAGSAALRPRPELDPDFIGPAHSEPRTRQPLMRNTDRRQEQYRSGEEDIGRDGEHEESPGSNEDDPGGEDKRKRSVVPVSGVAAVGASIVEQRADPVRAPSLRRDIDRCWPSTTAAAGWPARTSIPGSPNAYRQTVGYQSGGHEGWLMTPLSVMSQHTPCATWGWRGDAARPLRTPCCR